MTITLIGIFLFALSYYLRIRPRIKQADFGIDSWYYLLYTEEIRRTRRLPVKLPYFLLDIDEQWYPAGLPLILSFFKQRFLEKYHWAIPAIIDSLHLLLLYGFSYLITENILIASIAALLFATAPILVTHSATLNSRPLGALLLSLQMLFLYEYIISSFWIYLILIILSGSCLLHTHKLATQQIIILYIGFFIIYRNPLFIYIFGGVFLAAFLLSRGFYYKILLGHIQILKFWNKNLPFLFAHQVYQSPLYANADKTIAMRGTKGIGSRKFWYTLAKFQYAAIVVIILITTYLNKGKLKSSDLFLLNWFWINFLSVLIIGYFTPLKFLGEGQRYFMYGAFPAFLLLARLCINGQTNLNFVFLVLAAVLLINVALIYKMQSDQKTNMLATVDSDFNKVLDYVKQLPEDTIMCLPYSHCEPIAYFCRKKTLWGAHSYMGDKIESFFPVLLKPVEYFISTYALSYCLINKDYVCLSDLHLSIGYKKIMEQGRYIILEFQHYV